MWIPFKKILQAKKAIYISLKAKKKSKSKWDQLREKKKSKSTWENLHSLLKQKINPRKKKERNEISLLAARRREP